jgi:hypothetical protein
MSAARVRPARPAEAAILAEMANDLNDHVAASGSFGGPAFRSFRVSP